jgi:excisionase family DNA binding protein
MHVKPCHTHANPTSNPAPREKMKLLTLNEVIELLKVSESTARRWIKSGALPAFKLGESGHLRVRAEDLEEFVQRRPVTTTTKQPLTPK